MISVPRAGPEPRPTPIDAAPPGGADRHPAPAIGVLLLAGLSLLGPAPAGAAVQSESWRTRAERTEYRETGTYDEMAEFCRRLEGASPWVKVTSFGTSGQGRPLPLVVLSRDRAFTPEKALAAGKPVVLIESGIHAGEIEGKDAVLALMRDIAVTRERAALLDHVTLLVVPILSVDAHERRSRFNRINQNGPEEMGWRFNPTGLNLNRDWVKAETPEIRALLGQVFTRWWPHLLVDNHTTDGADYQYDLTYGISHGPATPPAVERWLVSSFEARVPARTDSLGHRVGPYIDFHGGDVRQGLDFGTAPPRFSTTYPTLQGRPAILVETHMLKPYGVRVQATYDFLVSLLEEVNAHPRELLDAVAEAERGIIARGRERDPARRRVSLADRLTDESEPLLFRGIRSHREPSEITGGAVVRYEGTPWDTLLPCYRTAVARRETTQPVGYLVPREWTVVADRLAIHGIRFHRLARAWADTVEVQRVLDWSAAASSFEGHRPIDVKEVALERRWREFRPGDLWIPLDQRSALVAVHLLEATAPDGLMYWNAFDTVFEAKEYAEDYVMEPIARRMMAADTALAGDFHRRLAADSTFARSPERRVDYFFRRSPWRDPEQNLHPAARALRAPPAGVLAR